MENLAFGSFQYCPNQGCSGILTSSKDGFLVCSRCKNGYEARIVKVFERRQKLIEMPKGKGQRKSDPK